MAVATRIAPTWGGPSYVQSVSFMAALRGVGPSRSPEYLRNDEGGGSFGGLPVQRGAAVERAREECGQVAGLFVEMDGGEHELDGPFGGQPLGLERVGEAEAADREVGAGGVAAVELALDILALGEGGAGVETGEVGADDRLVDVGCAHLERRHAAFAGEKARERDFQLAVGEEEHRAPVERRARARDRRPRTGARRGGDGVEPLLRDAERVGDGLQ